jgi:uncharacterized FAD-dependent dehydrogenase
MNFAQAFNPWAQFAQMGQQGQPQTQPGGMGGLGGMSGGMGAINPTQGLGATEMSPDMASMMQQWASMMGQGGANTNAFASFNSGSPVFRPDNQGISMGPRNGMPTAMAPMGMTGRY